MKIVDTSFKVLLLTSSHDINGTGVTNPGKIFLKMDCVFFRIKIHQKS